MGRDAFLGLLCSNFQNVETKRHQKDSMRGLRVAWYFRTCTISRGGYGEPWFNPRLHFSQPSLHSASPAKRADQKRARRSRSQDTRTTAIHSSSRAARVPGKGPGCRWEKLESAATGKSSGGYQTVKRKQSPNRRWSGHRALRGTP